MPWARPAQITAGAARMRGTQSDKGCGLPTQAGTAVPAGSAGGSTPLISPQYLWHRQGNAAGRCTMFDPGSETQLVKSFPVRAVADYPSCPGRGSGHVESHTCDPRAQEAWFSPSALHTYVYDPTPSSIGLQAAQALGVEPRRMLKTLMAEVDGKPVCVVVPSDREVSMKKLAAAFGGKTANMMRPADAERLTGYHVGGISPFGQKKRVPVAIEASRAEQSDRVRQWRPARPADRARSQ